MEIKMFTTSKIYLVLLILTSFTALKVTSTTNNHQSSEIIREKPKTTTKMPEQRIAPTIESLEEFEQKLPGYLNTNKTLSVLFDYDGTLAPIADNPNKTFMPVEIEVLLNRIAKHPNVFLAIISGRGITDVQARVGINGITYAGNHGIEIEGPDGTRYDYQLPAEVQESYKKLVKEMNEKVYKNKAFVEDKRVSLTYHYRDTPLDIKEEQKQLAIKIIESHGFRANQAHEALEAKPPVNWNKGEAALFILRNRFGNDWAEHTQVLFSGDDTTDEDAMKLLHGCARSFRVSTNPEIQTYADFRLPRQDVVVDLLKWIANVYSV